jgi:leader peptidase (prepilin peptidase) / N-methyltransferase
MEFVSFVMLLWCFAVGACIGSFLNVVAWRLPLGMSLSSPRSHCPSCKRPIQLRDNVPVLGWLWLRGRCRACGERISPRYPIVEFVTGATFAALAYFELVREGSNLPGLVPESLQALLGVWLYHSLLASLLIVTALFEIDEARVPLRFVVIGLLGGLIPQLLWPHLQPVEIVDPETIANLHDALQRDGVTRHASGLAGILTGGGLGWIVAAGATGKLLGPRFGLPYLTLSCALAGAFLGPWTAFTIVAATAALLVVQRLVGIARGGHEVYPASVAAIVTAVHILLWRPLTEMRWPGLYESRQSIAITAAAIVVLSVALRGLSRWRMPRRS